MKSFIKPTTLFFIFFFISCSSDDDGSGGEEIMDTVDVLVTVSPSDNERPVSKTPELNWETYSGGASTTYSLFLGTSENTLNEIVSGLSMVEFRIDDMNSLELGTTYYWKVEAYDNGELVAESETQTFITERISPTLITETAAYGSRKATGVVVFDDKIWVIGGIDEFDNSLDDIWSSADGENWVLEGNLPFGNIFGHELIAFNGKLWIYGGIFDGFQSRKIFSSVDGINWVEETETTPFIQYQNSKFIVLENEIFRIAGYSGEIDDLSVERNVYSSIDGLNWDLVSENHGFETKYGFQVETLNGRIFGMEPNPDTDINSISTRTTTDGANWSDAVVSNIRERGANSVRTVVIDDAIVLMSIPVGGPSNSSTFYESSTGENWELTTTIGSVPIRAIDCSLVNLNGELFSIGGTIRNNFSQTNNTVWKLN
ncbi:hypothetical protein HME9304_01367 [Flagellimonas maritima]|uniref:Fibronectin type-III domain-containing protein n=1 Tax=Flagellimonas maritima TaxID=1383885 RepID=A0A2Z4LSW7_9FLAO|nr:hypothetical protein [Allomuricauda aurantiaca]AWX44367.1 hypothetical protein HME9304_01367 [Allomuricauda aurantiaca]